MNKFQQLLQQILAQSDTVVELQTLFTSIPAISPATGGTGEWQKAQLLSQFLPECQLTWFNYKDKNSENPRPNLVAHYKGKSSKTLWLFAHLDVVSPGDLSLWHTDPWKITQEGDYIYGRGVEDNQQALVSMLVLVKCLHQLHLTPELSLGLVFMADEETGSEYGLKYLLENACDYFKPDDFYIVPDGGSPDASVIEIAEKAQLWLEFSVLGKQCHASMPFSGTNSLVAASGLIIELNNLNQVFHEVNPIFKPPVSTFVPTRHDANVEAVNILPGKDVFYLDCRILPGVAEETVLDRCRETARAIELLNGVSINIKKIQHQPATCVDPETPVLRPLKQAIRDIYNIEANPCGIGGATVAAYLRQHNLPAVVWACLENTCHQPNEHSSITATLKDAAVFANILLGQDYPHE